VKEKNIFSDEQEEWLGEIVDQSFRKEFHVVDDPEGRLQRLGEHLLAQLPPTKIHYRFVIVDSPELNSFGLVGGRIYVFRRLIAFVQNEDELAAVLGHEIGHLITHQSAIDITRLFRELGITEVGDRQDILNKWNLFMDNAAKIHFRHGDDQKEQMIADRVALYAMARAGYEPAQAGIFFDRLLLTKGKTGGFWSDFFGTTRPESVRLREILRNSTPLPAQCVSSPPERPRSFAPWQEEIIGAKRAVAKEELPGLLTRTVLQPPLRGDLKRTKFSPDGRYLLAQDESSIFVLSRAPLANLFRIDAPESYAAHFSPDSRSVVFHDKELRVEKWDIETRQRSSAHELNASRCWGSDLSPSGDVLACVRPKTEMQDPIFELQLIDVTTGKPFYTREKFYELSFGEWVSLHHRLTQERNPSVANIRFSPDGSYVVVARGQTVLAYDLKNRTEIKMPFSFKEAILSSFTFVTPDQILGFNELKGKLARISFPSGHISDEFPAEKRRLVLSSVGKGNSVLIRGGDLPVSILDLGEKRFTGGYKAPAFDLYESVFAAEEIAGQIVLGSLSEKRAIAEIGLPESPLVTVNTATFSNDGKWLAVSGRSRGGVWNLENGERIFYMTNFDGSFFDSKNQLFAKFPMREKVPARVYQIDPSTKGNAKLYDMGPGSDEEDDYSASEEENASSNVRQVGDLLLTLTPKSEKRFNHEYLLEARGIQTNNLLWQRKFEREQPRLFYSSAAKRLNLLIANYGNIKDAVKDDPRLREQLASMDAKKDSYLIQSLDSATGRPLGAVLVDTGKLSFKVERAISASDTVVVDDSINRVLVYSLKSGQQNGKVFGRFRAVSRAGDKMLVENGSGVVDIYETASIKSLTHLTFPARIIHAEFAGDDKSVLILSADQHVYRVSSSGPEKVADIQ